MGLLLLGISIGILVYLLLEKIVKFYLKLWDKEDEKLEQDFEKLRYDLSFKLRPKVIKIIVKLKNGVTIVKDFKDVVSDKISGPYIHKVEDSVEDFIKNITDDDGYVEKGDTIYPSHMIESIQRIVVE